MIYPKSRNYANLEPKGLHNLMFSVQKGLDSFATGCTWIYQGLHQHLISTFTQAEYLTSWSECTNMYIVLFQCSVSCILYSTYQRLQNLWLHQLQELFSISKYMKVLKHCMKPLRWKPVQWWILHTFKSGHTLLCIKISCERRHQLIQCPSRKTFRNPPVFRLSVLQSEVTVSQ